MATTGPGFGAGGSRGRRPSSDVHRPQPIPPRASSFVAARSPADPRGQRVRRRPPLRRRRRTPTRAGRNSRPARVRGHRLNAVRPRGTRLTESPRPARRRLSRALQPRCRQRMASVACRERTDPQEQVEPIPRRDRRDPRPLVRIWVLPTGVLLLAPVGAAASAGWPAQVVVPAAVILAALLYLFLHYAIPPERS